MNKDIFFTLEKLGGIESSQIEYKLCESTLSRSIWESVSAFANEKGGVILLGYTRIGDEYIPVGVDNPSQILDDFTSTVSQKFNFCPLVRAEVTEDAGKPVILIEIKESPEYQKPIYIQDAGPIKGGFRRVGATDIRLTDSDVQRYYQERRGSPDAQLVSGTDLSDIDPKTFSLFRNLRRLVKPDAPELGLNNVDLLKAYNLSASDGKTLSVAGLLLFGKEDTVKKHFPAMRLDIIRIKGNIWGREKDVFLSKDIRGNLLTLWTSAIDALDRFFFVPFRLEEGIIRTEEHAQREAVREALTNLLMHQNYFHPSPAQIRVYNNRVEFYNPGYSLKDPSLFESPGSELRNPLIAAVFYDIGWAETKGTGIKKTIDLLEREGYPLPEWGNDLKADTFTLTLSYHTDQVTPQDTPQDTPQVERMDRVAATLNYCEVPKSLKEIMVFLKLRDRKSFMERILNPLLEKGFLKRTIQDKPKSRFQRYVATKEG